MSEEKTFVFPEGAGSGSSVDPNVLLAMMNNGNGFGGGNWMWIIFLFFLYGWGGNGMFGRGAGLGNEINNDYGRELLSQAIAGNRTAISELATNLHVDSAAIQNAISSVQSSIQCVGNQVGMSAAQVTNAIQAGNQALSSQLAQCCCDNKMLVTTQGYENRINNLQQSQLIQNGFAQIGYANAENTCAIKQNATDNTNRVLAKLDAIEDSRKDREISNLTAALTAANARSERQAELTPIYKAIEKIPNTVPVQWPQLSAVPSAYLYGGYGNAVFTNGQWA